MQDAFKDDIRQARRGDREALERLLVRIQNRLTRLAQTRLGVKLRYRIRTSDILQSTYLDVVRYVEEFAGDTEDDFVTWVGRILENNIRDKRRYFTAGKRREEDAADDDVGERPRPGRGPVSQAAFGEELVLVGRALDNLSDEHRDVILWRMIRGRSYEEVAETMNRSQTAVRSLLSRARGSLLMELERLQHDRS